MTEHWTHVNHPEDERFDEIHIYTKERWKESELSGDEWRFSYIAEVKRKGEIVIIITANRMSWLLEGLAWKITTAGENNNFDHEAWKRTENLCDQPGCALPATIFYKRLKPWTREGDELVDHDYRNEYRQFCEKHKHRGDCDLDDADHNYERIEDPRKVNQDGGF